MAIPADTVWEVQTGGADTNGGGFSDANKGATGTDYSQQTAAQLTLTDGATSGVGVTTLTSATGGFTNLMLGNMIYIASGTNATVGYYCITAYTDTNTVTLDRAPDDGVGGVASGNFKVGGCLATPGMLSDAITVSDNAAWIKSGTYTLSTSTVGSGGPCYITGNFTFRIEGYGSTRGDLGTKPVLDAGAQTSVDLFGNSNSSNNQRPLYVNLIADGNSGASNRGFAGANQIRNGALRCLARDCDTGFINGIWDSCRAEGCTTVGFNIGYNIYKCVAYDCLQGFLNNSTNLDSCIAYECTQGYDAPNAACSYRNCVAYGNSSDGWQGNTRDVVYINCIAVNNGGWGFAGLNVSHYHECAAYNNTSGNVQGTELTDRFVTITGDPFVNGANGDFRLNDTAGQGAELRSVGEGVFGQTDNRDIGAVQHADPTSMYRRVPVSIGAGR